MLGNIGPVTLVLIVIAALLIFGPKKLPELGRALGRTVNELKKGAKEAMPDNNDDTKSSKIINAHSEQDDKDNQK